MAVDNFPRGTYEARVVEHPGRRTFTGIDPQTGEPTGETKVYDVTLNEGTVTQQGTAWTPSVMNDLENRIGNSVGQIKNEFTATQYKNDSSLTTDAQTVVGGINEANTKALNIAPVFSSSSTYTVGAYVFYQGVLYKCTVAVTTAGDWDANKWTQVKVTDEMGGGSATFAGLADTNFSNLQNGQIAKYNSTSGKWVNANESGGSAEFIKTVSGAVASFSDAQGGYPLVDLTAQIVPQQSGSGDPSPSNPRAISGFSSGTIYHDGANLWDEEWEVGDLSGVDGTPISASDRIRAKNYIAVKPSTTYYFKTDGTNRVRFWEYGFDKVGIELKDSMLSGAFTTGANTYYIRFYCFPAYGTTYKNDLSINYPSTDTSYHAYNGTTATVQFNQTIYGGTWKAEEGKVEPTYAIVDLADLSWTYQQDYSRWITTGIKTTIKIDSTTDTSKVIPAYCEKYKPTSYANLSTNEITYYNSDGNVFCNNGSSSETPTGKLAYLLDTPSAEISVDAVNLTAQDGTNNIFADTGDTSVTYATTAVGDVGEVLINDGRTASNTTWSSTKINTQLTGKQNTLTAGTGIDITSDTISVTDYIKDASVADEYDATATYAVGDYCIHGGLLYICTTAITVAEDWDATHWTQTNVVSQLGSSIDDTATSASTTWSSSKISSTFIAATDVTGTLAAGSTSITLSDASITTSSTIEVFNDLDVPYTAKTLATGSITLTFEAQQSAMSVKVRVS